MSDAVRLTAPEPRSARVLTRRRRPLNWPEDREFRILSIDGGGCRGIFPAAVLAEMERRYLGGDSVAGYFDLITGTSTGGIIAIGLGAGMPAAKILQFYMEDGRDIFAPRRRLKALWKARKIVTHAYDSENLKDHLDRQLGARTLRDSSSRLCIPSCDGTHGDVWVYKTPHHPDYQMDGSRRMVDVALATSAAPTYFRPIEEGGFRLLDGGLWANCPIMVGVVEAITALGASRERIRVLSLGMRLKTLPGGSVEDGRRRSPRMARHHLRGDALPVAGGLGPGTTAAWCGPHRPYRTRSDWFPHSLR